MARKKFPTPTNSANTCVYCGAPLRQNSFVRVELKDATPAQMQDWPIIHVYSGPSWNEIGEAEYYGSAYANVAWMEDLAAPRGLFADRPNRRRRPEGDGLFCTMRCAVGFARIAANAGFRMPSLTRKERADLRQQYTFLDQFAPDSIWPTSATPVPGDRLYRKQKPQARFFVRDTPAGTPYWVKELTFDPSIPKPKKHPTRF